MTAEYWSDFHNATRVKPWRSRVFIITVAVGAGAVIGVAFAMLLFLR